MGKVKKCLAMLLAVIMIISLCPANVIASSDGITESAILMEQDDAEDVMGENAVQAAYETGATADVSLAEDAASTEETATAEDQAADTTITEEAPLAEDQAAEAASTDEIATAKDQVAEAASTEETALGEEQAEDAVSATEIAAPAEAALPLGDTSIAADASQAEEVTAAQAPTSDEDLVYEQGTVGEAIPGLEAGELSEDYGEESVVGASNQAYDITFKYGQTEARSMLDMVNTFRQGSDAWYWAEGDTTKVTCSGLSKLTYDYQLEKAAMIRAKEIAVLFSHTRPNGAKWSTVASEIGYSYSWFGENIAAGYTTARSAYTGWREDNYGYSGQGHRRKMLSEHFNRIGIGHVYYNGMHFWVQEFAYSTGTISSTTANNSTVTESVNLSDTYITSASGTASPSSITVGVNKTCALPTVTMTLEVMEPGDTWSNTVKAVPSCTWTSKNSSIAAIKSGKLSGAALGSTTITTTVNGVTISVPVTVNFEPVRVGDVVTAQIVLEGSSYVLYFDSEDGTLWNNWKSIVGSLVSSVNTIKLSSDSGKMYLPANSSSLFSGMSKLKSIDLSNVDSSKVTNAKAMFSGCSSLTTLDLSNFDMSSVTSQTNANDIFKNCTSLATINTPKKTNASVNMILPATFVDDNANQLVRLPINASSSIKITKYSASTTPVINLSKCTATISPTSYTYNGSARKPSVTVKHSWTKETAGSNSTVTTTTMTTTLSAGTNYTVAYSNNVKAGTGTVTITGKGNYTGTIKKTFTIAKATPTLKFASSTVSKTSIDDPFTNTLTKTTDGTVTFKSGNTAVATVDSSSGKVTITGIGSTTITATAAAGTNYKTGSAKYTLKVADGRIDISKCTVALDKTGYIYSGSANKPTATVTYQNKTLTLGTDYTVEYANNVNVGEANATVTGIGKYYKGSRVLTFVIDQAEPTLEFASTDVKKTTTDDPFTNVLTMATDGSVTFESSDTNVATVDSATGLVTMKGIGTATITVTASEGTNYKAGSADYKLTVVQGRYPISTCTLILGSYKYTYNGSAKKPATTIWHLGSTLKLGTDYTVSYSNNVNAGKATVKVTGKGKYTGSMTQTFTIDKAAPTLKFAKSSISKTDLDKAFTNKLTTKTDGTVTFKSGNKAVATVNSKTGKVTIKGAGTVTITATAAAGKNYKAGSAKYTLKVTKKVIVPIYRLFNTKTGEHFYTASTSERQQYLAAGSWASEGVAWYAPKKSSQPIYRLSNPNNGNEHHYTKSSSEKDWLVSLGWHYDCVAWYSDTDKLVPIYRHYHPIQRTGNHHYTTSKGESDHIVQYEGWKYEGISFYVSKAGG